MTVAPACLAASTWVVSWAASMAPMTITLAPLVTMAEICDCCSETPPVAYCTSDLKPASLSPLVNRSPATTQFSEVFVGSETPINESAAKPPLAEFPPLGAELSPLELRLEEPVIASRAIAAAQTRLTTNLRVGEGGPLGGEGGGCGPPPSGVPSVWPPGPCGLGARGGGDHGGGGGAPERPHD